MLRWSPRRRHTIALSVCKLQAQECGSDHIPPDRSQAARGHDRYVKRAPGGKIWIRIFPDKPVTMPPCRKHGWAPVRATRSLGWPLIKPVASSLRLGGLRSASHRKQADASGPVQAAGQTRFIAAKPKMATELGILPGPGPFSTPFQLEVLTMARPDIAEVPSRSMTPYLIRSDQTVAA